MSKIYEQIKFQVFMEQAAVKLEAQKKQLDRLKAIAASMKAEIKRGEDWDKDHGLEYFRGEITKEEFDKRMDG